MLTNLKIELAKSVDADWIAMLSRRAIEHDLAWSWTPARVRKAISNRNNNIVVARHNGKLVGFGIMRYYSDISHLLLLAVSADMRNKSVGSALLNWLEQVAFIAGIAKIRLEARANNTSAIAFYRKHGYREIRYIEDMYQGVEDGVRFEKIIICENQKLC